MKKTLKSKKSTKKKKKKKLPLSKNTPFVFLGNAQEIISVELAEIKLLISRLRKQGKDLLVQDIKLRGIASNFEMLKQLPKKSGIEKLRKNLKDLKAEVSEIEWEKVEDIRKDYYKKEDE